MLPLVSDIADQSCGNALFGREFIFSLRCGSVLLCGNVGLMPYGDRQIAGMRVHFNAGAINVVSQEMSKALHKASMTAAIEL